MEKEINRCMSCMCEKSYKGVCEMCGHTDDEPVEAGCLRPKTFLADRYVIGRVLARRGEGTDYIAFDTVDKKAVEIMEFMPDTLCDRTADGVTVEVKDGCLPLYKSYLSEFADLHKTLMSSMEGISIKKVYGIFASGNTGYVVMEHPNGVSFTQYLEESGGIISWGQAKELFPPVFDALKALHEKGIVHRGLSTDTLFVRDRKRLMLTSIGISAGRTADSRINSDMISGYAAFEQYALSERQGSWTDVYGICAVLYRALTGNVPPSAELRGQEDTIVPPDELNPDIPKYVSETIMNGLKTDRNERFHDIDSLVRRLYTVPTGEMPYTDSSDDGPVVIESDMFDDEPRKTHEKASPKKTGSGKGKSGKKSKKSGRQRKDSEKKSGVGTAIGFFFFLALVIALIIAIIYFSKETEKTLAENEQLAVTDSSYTDEAEATSATTSAPVTTVPKKTVPAETTPQGERIIMPNFINRFFNSSLESRYSGLVFVPVYEYRDDHQAGIIFEQSIEDGAEVPEGTEVEIKISKGKAEADIPDFIGMKLADYTKKLDEAGIKYETEGEETGEVKAGYVVRLSKEYGEKINITEEEAETLTVYYAVKPQKTTAATENYDEELDEIDEELDEIEEIEED